MALCTPCEILHQRLEIEGDKESVRRFGKETEVC